MHPQIQHDCTVLTDKCINAKRQDNQKPASLKIDQSFFYDNPDKTKRCLTLAVVTGDIDCKYWMADGLCADVSAAKQLSNKALRSAVRDRPASWEVEPDRMPDEAQPYSYDFAEVTCFTKQLKFLSSHVAKTNTGRLHHMGALHGSARAEQPTVGRVGQTGSAAVLRGQRAVPQVV
jgi:hypothetical protein